MDNLRLQIRAKDEIQPVLLDLKLTMDRFSVVSEDFEGKVSIEKWYVCVFGNVIFTKKNMMEESFMLCLRCREGSETSV